MTKLIACGTAALALALSTASWADTNKGVPADQVIAAIQAAVAAQPGNIKDVEVEDRRDNTPVVEVEIIAAGDKKHKVKVDAGTRQIVK